MFDDVLTGRLRTLVLYGEAGIGKTRLVAEAVASARRQGFTTLLGAAEPAERGRPFGAISHVLRSAAGGDPSGGAGPADGALSRLLAELEPPGRGDDWADPMRYVGFTLTDTITEQLEHAAATGPLLIALEDLHWADRPSTGVVAAIARQLADRAVALIVTLRGGDAPMHVNELLDRLTPASTQLLLRPLDDDSIAGLAGELAGGTPSPQLRQLLTGAGGNPFFATELVRALRDEGQLAVSGGVADSTSSAIPDGVRQTVLRRLRLLPQDTVELLELASILGQSFAMADLALLAQRSAVAVARDLAPALRSHTLRESGELLSFGHALTWEAVYHELPMTARRAVHRQAASLLADAGVPPIRVARHFVLGADVGDHEAVSWLRQAARASAPGSPVAAAELLGNALDLAGPEHPDRDSITAELAPLLVVTGRVTQAATLTGQALARRLDPRIEARLRVGLTHVLMRSGRVDDAREQVDRLLQRLPGQAGDLAAGAASYVQLASGDVDLADSLARRALAAAEQAGNDVVIATALMTLTWTEAASGRIAEAVETGQRAVAVTEGSRAPFSGFLFPHTPLGAALLQADRLADADRAFADGLVRADRTSAPGSIVYHHAGMAAAKFVAGDWDDALSEAEVAIELGTPTGTSWALLPSAIIARIAVARDDLTGAAAVLAEARSGTEAAHRTMMTDWLHSAQAVQLAAIGELGGALAAVEAAWRAAPGHDLVGGRVPLIDCVRLAMTGGRPELAREIAGHLDEVAGQDAGRHSGSLGAAALHCRGLAGEDSGALLAAVELLRGSPRRYQLAMACEDAAAALEPERTAEAKVLFADALAGYRELHARRDVARLAAAMRTRGVRLPVQRTRTRSDTELTRTERAVADLVAQGLSNPQIAQRLFISRHTAQTHLKHIFNKLRVTSRAELAAHITKQVVASR